MSEQNINIRIGDTVPLELYQNLQYELNNARSRTDKLRECMRRMVLRDHCEAIAEDKLYEFNVREVAMSGTPTHYEIEQSDAMDVLNTYWEAYRNKKAIEE